MCFCTPTKRTPVCDGCPHDIQIKWGLKKEKKQMNCDTSMPMPCECRCHSSGIKQMFATNPPQPCCMCEALTYSNSKPQVTWDDYQYLLKEKQILEGRLEKLEKFMEESNPIHQAHSFVHDEWEDRQSDLAKRIITIENFISQNYQRELAEHNSRIERLEDYIKRQSELPSIDCGEINKVIDRINKFDETNDKKPHRCPVCDGNGEKVYLSGELSECHACEGKGALWG